MADKIFPRSFEDVLIEYHTYATFPAGFKKQVSDLWYMEQAHPAEVQKLGDQIAKEHGVRNEVFWKYYDWYTGAFCGETPESFHVYIVPEELENGRVCFGYREEGERFPKGVVPIGTITNWKDVWMLMKIPHNFSQLNQEQLNNLHALIMHVLLLSGNTKTSTDEVLKLGKENLVITLFTA